MDKHGGFTLLEVLLSLALISVLAGASVPVYQSFETRNNLDLSTAILTQTLRRAEILSRAVDGDISWGVKIQSGSIVLFKGTSYSLRDASFDEVFDISSAISYSGPGEIVFSKFSGLPQIIGSIVLTSTNGETRTINVNGQGLIAY